MSDDEDYAFYGDPLEPLDDDNYHKQKAPKLEDQIVTDDRGRRRFHGAFTGGFSAGYFNTVGTKEGWTPSTFSSSRASRVKNVLASSAVDFMDDEDMEAHGIAPQGIQAKTDFDIHERPKRKRIVEQDGPIPGNPVLTDILKPIRETVGMKVLKKFGWKPGQGIGPRVLRKEKKQTFKENKRLFGCQLPPGRDLICSSDDDEPYEPDSTFAPSDQNSVNFDAEKDNFFGLGYKPMSRPSNLGSISNPLKMADKNKKLSIVGHAFGVGAFEDDDDDIYGKEDLSNYDFSLGPSLSPTKKQTPVYNMDRITDQLDGFVISGKKFERAKSADLPVLPSSFIPKHTPVKRRFNLEEKHVKGLGRHELSAGDRRRILSTSEINTEIRSGVAVSEEEVKSRAEAHLRIDALLSEQRSNVAKNFQPYSKDAEKQKRYELYCRMKEKGMKDRFNLVQPKNMIEWEKEREVAEFERSESLFKPLVSSMAARFTKASREDISIVSSSTEGKTDEIKMATETDVRRDAARSKMFGKLTQTRVNWHPDPVVCKRFFVTNPYSGSTIVGVPGTKHDKVSIFNFLQAPLEETAGLQIQDTSKDGVSTSQDTQLKEIKHRPVSDTEDLPIESNEPPTMDLFKAIFQDSDTESDQSDDEIKIIDDSDYIRKKSLAKPTQEMDDNITFNKPDLSNMFPATSSEPVSSTPSATSKPSRQIPIIDLESSLRHSENPESSSSTNRSNSESKPIFKIPKSSINNPTKMASGIFSNIDFEVLNEYRNTTVTPTADSTMTSASSSVTLHSHSSNSDAEEYGPAAPSGDHKPASRSHKDKKKSKHKKHRKEKKKHKHKL